MIDMHLIVQGECMVALSPIVPDALMSIDDQRVNTELGKARGSVFT